MRQLPFLVVACGAIAGWVTVGLGPVGARAADCRTSPCAITLTKVVTLKDREPRQLIDYSVNVVQDRAGRFFTASRDRKGIVVFDPSGARIKVLTHPAFKRIAVLNGNRGSVLVSDVLGQTLYTIGANLEIGGPTRLPFGPSLMIDGGQFLVVQQVRTPERAGYPLHVMDANGAIVRSFGVDAPKFTGGVSRVNDRRVAPSANGGVWAAAPGRYVLERWSTTSGTRTASVAVKSSWFVESANAPDERKKPTPVVEALWEQDRLVWTLVRVADTAWKPPVRPNTERAFDLPEYDRTYDWVIEAIDPETGAVVAHRRLPSVHWTGASAPLLTSRAVGGAGASFDVWKPTLADK